MLQKIFTIAIVGVLAAGCAASKDPEAIAQNDPYESTNRSIFDLNTKLDKYFAKPVAQGYNTVVPQFARTGVHNFLATLDKPVTFGNDLLQGEGTRAGETLGRFTVNVTLGVGGLVDVATMIGIPDHSEDFGQTLGVYGVGEGPYLVMPFMGPKPPRDLAGGIVDIFIDPTTYISFHGSDTWYAVRSGVSVLDLRARNIDTLDQIERTSIDLYATTRSLYRQYRNSEIRNGAPDTSDSDTPDF
ncbi:MlaA family lipoprotein [Rhizomicrobium electricum]|jgi:phospholipid-binding lipoprotein MlaA|uniref:VacJ family lipoprotein n=1 Tax=Rhizomicrobium electricum TaxID=480070 RepID=A0ABP3PVP9_9PROT|nr:VacJ family lipoprotein [Rhizomicrobium electricum]NIJ49726.1 phospholipid-binding lipoprotein MlaA [Rhizomicrobium electricum]